MQCVGITEGGANRAEYRHDAVAYGLDLPATILGEEHITPSEMSVPHRTHANIAKPVTQRCRADNVCEYNRQGSSVATNPLYQGAGGVMHVLTPDTFTFGCRDDRRDASQIQTVVAFKRAFGATSPLAHVWANFRFPPIAFSNESRDGGSFVSDIDAVGCLCSLRARVALDSARVRLIWSWRGRLPPRRSKGDVTP